MDRRAVQRVLADASFSTTAARRFACSRPWLSAAPYARTAWAKTAGPTFATAAVTSRSSGVLRLACAIAITAAPRATVPGSRRHSLLLDLDLHRSAHGPCQGVDTGDGHQILLLGFGPETDMMSVDDLEIAVR